MAAEVDPDPTSFELASILDRARASCGLDDFGPDEFLEPLRHLLEAWASEAGLHEIGRMTQRARIVDSLVTRLSAQDHFARHPEILEEEIVAPYVVVGLARTGTTMLHRLLAADPGVNAVLWWECRNPAPFPGSDWRREDPRIAQARAEVEMILETQPVLASIHPWDAEGPDEEIMLLEHAFVSHVPESSANVPSYRAWVDTQDWQPAYDWMKKLLQFLQWQKKESGRAGERWVLKAPVHLGYMDALFATFPDARVIQTHRDPVETIPSVASMYHALWGLATDASDPQVVGAQVCERWAWALRRCLASRARIGEERFLDVWYRDVVDDPMAQVRRIYDFVERELTPEVEEAMARWRGEHSRGGRPAHEYAMERFGLTEHGICEAFAAYRERFIETSA
jgi:hypothetical protein